MVTDKFIGLLVPLRIITVAVRASMRSRRCCEFLILKELQGFSGKMDVFVTGMGLLPKALDTGSFRGKFRAL